MYSPHVPELAINEPFAIEVDNRRGGSKRRALAVVAIAFLGLGAFVALSGSDNTALDSTTAASTSLSAAEPKQILVHPSDNLSAVVAHASPGDVLLLADGVYQPGAVVEIDKNITIAAQNDGRAVIDGQKKHRVIHASQHGVVTLKG